MCYATTLTQQSHKDLDYDSVIWKTEAPALVKENQTLASYFFGCHLQTTVKYNTY